MSDGAKKEDDHAWSALVIDEQGVAIRAYSKVLCKGGSSWVAEWCGKFLAYLLLKKYDINPHQLLGQTLQMCLDRRLPTSIRHIPE